MDKQISFDEFDPSDALDRSTERYATSAHVLLVEDLSTEKSVAKGKHSLRALHVPTAPSLLISDRQADESRFVVVDPTGLRGLRGHHGIPDTRFALFEPAYSAAGERLLLWTLPGSALRLNGLPAPLIAPLALGDQLVLESTAVLHVSRVRSGQPIAPAPELVGRACEICLVPFTPTTKVVPCPAGCGAARHLEGDDVPEDKRLTCALLGACAHCGAESELSEGFAFWPES
jgi:hypothetical protein